MKRWALATGNPSSFPYFCRMLDAFKAFIDQHQLFDPTKPQLVAVSGGIDSVVMGTLFHLAGIPFGVAHLNHQLRADESEEDATFVEDLTTEWEVPYYTNRFQTQNYAGEKGISIQMAARANRLWWLEGLQEEHGYETIALGNHQGDQVETILLNLVHGTSLSGLRGILPKRDKWVRPMLFCDRKQIATFAEREKIAYREDSSNQSDDYERNRIRHHVMPVLRKINPSLERTVARNVQHLIAVEQAWSQLVEDARQKVFSEDGDQLRISLSELKSCKPLSAYVYELLQPYGFSPSQTGMLMQLLSAPPGRELSSATHTLFTDREVWILVPRDPHEVDTTYSIFEETACINKPIQLHFSTMDKEELELSRSPEIASLDADLLQFPLTLRTWKIGDRFQPLGMTGSKKLSDFFTDQKIARPNKQTTWLLCSGEDIVWVLGQRIDERYKVGEHSKKIYIATWLKA